MAENGTQVLNMGAETARPREHKSSPAVRRVGYVAAIIVNLVLLYVFHRLITWGAPVITREWARVLPAFDLSIGATIVANVLFIGYDAGWFRRLAQIGLNVLGLRAMLIVYLVFPFALRVGRVEQWLRIGLLVVMAGIAIGTLVEGIRLLFGRE